MCLQTTSFTQRSERGLLTKGVSGIKKTGGGGPSNNKAKEGPVKGNMVRVL